MYDVNVARYKMMAAKLAVESEHGRVESVWDEEFIISINQQLKMGRKLSNKQVDKLEELWEKY